MSLTIDLLRAEFLRLLTVDSETKDRRRREYNQAIFDADEGWAVFNGTDLDMVMQKFDRAVRLMGTPQEYAKGYADAWADARRRGARGSARR